MPKNLVVPFCVVAVAVLVFASGESGASTLEWSTFLGGSASDGAIGLEADSEGNVVVVGDTNSPNFPATEGLDTTYAGQYDVFVAKYSPSGQLLWATYLGGAGDDRGYGIAVDSNNDIVVTGDTSSADFPTTGGFETEHKGGYDPFVTKLSASGQVVWSSFLEGSSRNMDFGYGATTDASNNIFVTGCSNGNAFVTKITAAGERQWTAVLEGSGDDWGFAIDLAPSGDIFVTGVTNSADFPAANGFDPSYNGGISDAFIAKIDANGSPVWASFLGGVGEDRGYDVKVDAASNVYVTGYTYSYNLPTPGGFDRLYVAGEAFVAKITPDLQLGWSSFIGGSGEDWGFGLRLDSHGNLIVTGGTRSADFQTPGGFDKTHNGLRDAFVAKITPSARLVWSTYLGGSNHDFADDIALDSAGNVLLAGSTASADFPTPNGADTALGGTWDSFVAKIAPGHLLSVQSTPPGVAITGDKPGTTDYTATCDDGAVVNLTAPADTSIEGVTHAFVRWSVDGVDQADGVATLQVTLEGNRAVVAAYQAQVGVYTLSVQSAPVSGIAITGDKPGTTGYTAQCDTSSVVNLTAPASATVGEAIYTFVRWQVDGAGQDAGLASIQVTMDAAHTAVAAYQVQAPATQMLTVQSTPVTGIAITGDKPGTTDYTAACTDQHVVTLTAPAAAALDGSNYEFVRWAVDGQDKPFGQASVEVTMDAAHTAVAAYQLRPPQTFTLSVQSVPSSAVQITGSRPGTTPYSGQCDENELVTLEAPAAVSAGGSDYTFMRWSVDGVYQQYGQRTLQVMMDADHAVACNWMVVGGALIALEGPAERNEGPLPYGAGTVTINVYAQGFADLAGIQLGVNFLDFSGASSAAFSISKTNGNELFNGLAVWPNTAVFPSIFPVYNDEAQMAGFALLSEGGDLLDRTLLMTIKYDYSSGAFGTYEVDADPQRTEVADSNAQRVPFNVSAGSLAVSGETLYVDDDAAEDPAPNGSVDHPFPSIGQAVAAAGPATRSIKVAAGTYAEELVVNGKALQVEGGWDSTFSQCDPAANESILDSSQVANPSTKRPVTIQNVQPGVLSGFTILRQQQPSDPVGTAPPGYVGSWQLEDSAADDTGVNNAVLNGGTYVDGKVGRALALNGTSNFIDCGNNASLNFPASVSFSVSIWLKRAALEIREQDIIAKHSQSWQGWRIGLVVWGGSSMKAYFGAGSATKAYYAYGSFMNDLNWHHAVAVVNRADNTICIYIDNVQFSRLAIPAGFDANAALWNVNIGRRNSSMGRCFQGSVDQARIYNRALTTDDVAALFNERPVTQQIPDLGGAVYCAGSSVLVLNNRIRNHSALTGGGICCVDGTYTVEGNRVNGNSARTGAGIHIKNAAATLRRNLVVNNVASVQAGGLCLEKCTGTSVANNTIAYNTAPAGTGGALMLKDHCTASLVSAILWGNSSQLAVTGASALAVSYCDVPGGKAAASVETGGTLTWGAGNYDADPLFADAINGDFHELSQDGRWNPQLKAWAADGQTSPCIDGGDPAADYSNEPQPDGFRMNCGAYGNTAEASKNRHWKIPGDVTGDCSVSILDLIWVRNKLGQSASTGNNWRADVAKDGLINILDLIQIRNNLGKRCP